MNKISIYALTFFLSLSSVTVYSQKNNKQVIFTNEQGSDIFYHTIERGQTVYAIATMYGVSVEDIYRLNPESKEGIKAGSTLRIPQKDSAIAPSGKADNYTYHPCGRTYPSKCDHKGRLRIPHPFSRRSFGAFAPPTRGLSEWHPCGCFFTDLLTELLTIYH